MERETLRALRGMLNTLVAYLRAPRRGRLVPLEVKVGDGTRRTVLVNPQYVMKVEPDARDEQESHVWLVAGQDAERMTIAAPLEAVQKALEGRE